MKKPIKPKFQFPFLIDPPTATYNAEALEFFKQKYSDLLTRGGEGSAVAYTLSQAFKQGNPQAIEALLDLSKTCMQSVLALIGSCEPQNALGFTSKHIQHLSEHIHALNEAAKKNLTLRGVAVQRDNWPIVFYRHNEDRKNMQKLILDEFQLGAIVPLNFSGGFSRQTTGTRIAHHLFNLLWGCRTRKESPWHSTEELEALPSFTKKNSAAWFKASLPIFAHGYGERFEDHKSFASLWKSATYSGLKPHEKRARIRSDIKHLIKQGFKSIAPSVE